MRARTRGTLATAAILVTGAAIAIVGSRPESPFTPPLPRGSVASWPLRGTLSLLGVDRLSRGAVAALGAFVIFAAAGAFLYALGRAWRRELTIRRIVSVALLLHLLALAMPVFLSRDVYSYAFYGRMVSRYGANPYTEIPAGFASDPTYPFVSVDWIDSPSVYGPAFTALSAGVTSVTSSPEGSAIAFKVLAALASLAAMVLTAAAARRVAPEREAFAAALLGWNPVVVFHGVAGGHNDALLGLALSAGVLAVLARRELWATGVLALGTLVKVSGGVPMVLAAVGAAVARARGARLRRLGLHAGVAAAVAAPFVIPFVQTEDPSLGALELASRQGWLAPSRFVLQTFRGAARLIGGDAAADIVSLIVRVAFPLIFLWVLIMLVRHLASDPSRITPAIVVAAMGWAALVSLLVAPILLPWYAAWVIPLAWILPRVARGGAVVLSLALAVTELVAEPARSPGVYEAMVFGLHWVATPLMLLILLRILRDLRARVAAGPGRGFEDPLLAEERPEPASVGGPQGHHVSGDRDGAGQREGPSAPREETDPIGPDGAQDGDGDSH